MAIPDGPPPAPTEQGVAEYHAFLDAAPGDPEAITKAAERWREGLAALAGLVATGLVLKGPTDAQSLTQTWRIALTVGFVAATALIILALYKALQAAAGNPRTLQLNEIEARWGSFPAMERAVTKERANQLRWARTIGILGVLLLMSTTVMSWYADTVSTASPLHVRVGDEQWCGTVDSTADGVLHLSVVTASDPVPIPLADITDLVTIKECP